MNFKQINNILTVGVFSVVVALPIEAIQRKTAYAGTTVVAIASGLGGYQAWLVAHKKIHPAFFGAAGTLCVGLVYNYLYSITPQGRFKRASRLLDELARHKLVKNYFKNDRDFFDAVHDVYLTNDLPLIGAYNHLVGLQPTIQAAFDLIDKASVDVDKDCLLQEESVAISARAKELFTNISEAIKKIREHRDYLAQLQIYKEFLVNDKQALAQEKMAEAQVQMAHSHQSSTLLKWLKAIFWGK